MNTQYVTASELGEYVYCECCWADRLEGNVQQTEEMIRGTLLHERLQWLSTVINFLRQVALVIIIGSFLLLVLFGILLYFTGNL